MARPVSPTLTEAELRLMKVLWTRGPSTAGEVVKFLAADTVLAESTVRTMLGILRDKGYVRRTRRGRAHLFHPLVERAEAQRGALRHVISRFFEGSPALLVLSLLRDPGLDAAERERLRGLVERSG